MRFFSKTASLPQIETERLVLRQLKISDTEDMFEYARHEITTEFLLWSPHENMQRTRNHLSYLQSLYSRGEYFDWAVVIKSTKKMIGTCGFADIDKENNVGEIGYVLNSKYWHQGYATEAIRAAIHYGFYDLRLNKIVARIMDGNKKSIDTILNCQFRYEGTAVDQLKVKGSYKTIHYYALLRKDYEKNGEKI